MAATATHEPEVTFKVGIDPGVWVPGHIVRTLNRRITARVRRATEDKGGKVMNA
jgi:hypothetical protein